VGMERPRLLALLACLAAALVVCQAVTDDGDQAAGALVEERATLTDDKIDEAQREEQRLERVEQMLDRLERKGSKTATSPSTRFLDLGEFQAPAAAAPTVAPNGAAAPAVAPPATAPSAPTTGRHRSVKGVMGRLDAIESAIKELQRSQMSAAQIAQAISGSQSAQIRQTAAVEAKSIMDFAKDRANQIRQAVVSNDLLNRQGMIDSQIAKFPVQLQVAATRQSSQRRQSSLNDLTLVPEMMRA